jgi:Uma2 family endonuclease
MVAAAIAENISVLEEYQALPEGAKYQLIEGKIIEMPSPLEQHQELSMQLIMLLGNHIFSKRLGRFFHAPFDVYLSEKNVYQPDLLFVSSENAGLIERRGVMGAPDLVIELSSESTDHIDKKKKLHNYEKHGVKEYFIVDPEDNEVISYYLEDGRYKAGYLGFNKIESRILDKTFEW